MVKFDQAGFEELKHKARFGLPVRTHSGLVRPGDIFLASPGVHHDGAEFIKDALNSGAAYVVAENDQNWPEDAAAKLIIHPEPKKALGELAAAYFGTDCHPLALVGITGTNGKTTVTYMIEHLLTKAGFKVGVMGTVTYRWPHVCLEARLTTPDCWSIHSILADMAKSGVDVVLMEVSSHSLAQDRVMGVDFSVGVFTNLTQDHLDYHEDMEEYFKAKARLFTDLPRKDKVAVINMDDPYGKRLLDASPRTLPYGLECDEDSPAECLCGELTGADRRGVGLNVRYKDRSWSLASSMVGRHNAYNLLAAQGVGLGMGLNPQHMKALESFPGVPGRLERVPNSMNLDIFVDYAHTPDALENVLAALKNLNFKRLLVVFGCGGDRDKGKRPLMGEAVARLADVAVLTSDNPRFEDPEAIIAQVLPGLEGCPEVIVEPDRKQAIAKALDRMRVGDALLVAGKGHENMQIIGDEKRPFSDAAVVRELLRCN